jgi:hypothetical protein
MTPRLTLERGGQLELEALEGERVVATSTVPAPPGATLVARLSDVDEPLEVKVKSCRRQAATGVYRIEGRAMNLSRRLRARLSAAD